MVSRDAAPKREAVTRMSRRLTHRGPDGSGVWESPSQRAVLANTRLAIFDLSAEAAQPLSSCDGRFTITYNGALYNHDELRRELERHGDRFRTTSDTEVIVRAYARYGRACVDRFLGMFAFAIWDEGERRLFMARDACGIKPLYYACVNDALLFASELRALAASRSVPVDADAEALFQYFRLGSVPEPQTLLRSAHMLPAGATADWHDGALTVHAAAPWPTPADDEGDAVERTRAALQAAVDRHFAGDVPVGVLLSGGVDSTAIVALAAKHRTARQIEAISMGLPGRPEDESSDARRAADHFGLRHHVVSIDAGDAKREFDRYAAALDQPTVDGLNTFIVARHARQLGIKALLSGIGADEIFGGYPSFRRVPLLARCHRLAASTGPLARSIGKRIEIAGGDHKRRRVGDLLQQPPSLSAAYETFRGVFTRRESRRLVKQFLDVDMAETHDSSPAAADEGDVADAVSRLEITRYARNQLLRDSDVMSMASGVELRTPFFDRALIDAMWRLPSASRIQRGKQLLVDAVPELPSWVAASPKRCFQLPIADWLLDGWRGIFDDVTSADPVETGTWYRKWSLFAAHCSLRHLREARDG